MKYTILIFTLICSLYLQAQEVPPPPQQPEIQSNREMELIKKNFQKARQLYESKAYQAAKEQASRVSEEASAAGMNKEFQESLKLMICCDQITGLEKSREEADGIGKAAVTLQLSEVFFKNGDYEKAAECAAEAYDEAAKYDDKSFMASALNKEARAVMKNKNAPSAEKAEAKQKFRTSLKLLAEHKVVNPILKKDNLDHLEEWGTNIINSREVADAREAVRFVLDSITANLGKWKDGDLKIVISDEQDPPHPPHTPDVEYKSDRREKRHELFNKIVTLDRDRMAKELIEPLPPPPPGSPEVNLWVDNVTKEMKELWPAKIKVIESEFLEREKRIGNMKPEDMREELLLATYKSRYDSLMHLHILDSINLEKQELAIKQHETEMQRQKIRRSLMMTGSGGTLVLAAFLLIGFTRQKKTNRLLYQKNQEIKKEQVRSDELLLNILPAQVADELKEYGAAQARHYDNVTVLFSDFKDFSKIAETLSPDQLVEELDYCFKAFDQIVSKHDLEKIKTIGDAYMCAGGLPTPNGDHANRAVNAAIEMQQFLENWKKEKILTGEPYFEARIGIHTGPVVAGVVGTKKFAYDIWGDTVNIASRMESGSEPGKINISGVTHRFIQHQFRCRHRGKVEVKNRGEIDMYFVE
jgi:class 3 adenylate cyclase